MKSTFRNASLATLAIALICVGITLLTDMMFDSIVSLKTFTIASVLCFVVVVPFLFYSFLRQDRNRTAYQRLEKAHRELQARSRIDHMTGLLNRESLFEAIKISRSRLQSGALLVIDADHFKNINDTFGHAIGDRALKLIAFALQNVTRKGDLVGRIGGEEFCVFLPGASRETAIRVAQRIRAEVEGTPFYSTEHHIHPLTISIGGVMAPKSFSSSQILSRADHNLYVAKQRGRNCVVFDEERIDEALYVVGERAALSSPSDGRESFDGREAARA